MSQDKINASHFSKDVQEFLRILRKYDVKYLITGGEAVIYYGYARLTGDVDFFYDCGKENASKLYDALLEFWDGNIPGIEHYKELMKKGLIVQFGMPPNRIDLINVIDDVTFEEAWSDKKEVVMTSRTGDFPVYYISLGKLIKNKKAAGRPKDIDDLDYLMRAST